MPLNMAARCGVSACGVAVAAVSHAPRGGVRRGPGRAGATHALLLGGAACERHRGAQRAPRRVLVSGCVPRTARARGLRRVRRHGFMTVTLLYRSQALTHASTGASHRKRSSRRHTWHVQTRKRAFRFAPGVRVLDATARVSANGRRDSAAGRDTLGPAMRSRTLTSRPGAVRGCRDGTAPRGGAAGRIELALLTPEGTDATSRSKPPRGAHATRIRTKRHTEAVQRAGRSLTARSARQLAGRRTGLGRWKDGQTCAVERAERAGSRAPQCGERMAASTAESRFALVCRCGELYSGCGPAERAAMARFIVILAHRTCRPCSHLGTRGSPPTASA